MTAPSSTAGPAGSPTLPMLMGWARSAFIWGGFAVIVLLGYRFMVRDAFRYVDWSEAVYLRFWPQRIPLAIHAASASIGLAVAPFQFSDRIRARWPKWHRWSGWIYVVCALLTAPTTFYLGFFSACTMCIPPFAIWSFVFGVVTILAVVTAVQRNFVAHRQFMVRSWLLMNGFVFVRLDDLFPYPLPVGPDVLRPGMIIWAVWVVPLVLAEMWFSWGPLLTRRRGKAPRAVPS